MKKYAILLSLTLSFVASLSAQKSYNFSFSSPALADGKYYIGQHFRDEFILLDSANAANGSVRFSQPKTIKNGVYALLGADKKRCFDFLVDDSRNFSISADDKFSNKGMKVKGSKANELMFSYLNRLESAREESKAIAERRKSNDPAVKKAAEADMEALNKTMTDFETNYFKQYANYGYTNLLQQFAAVDVPQEIPAGSSDTSLRDFQAHYYRMHYWDKVNLSDHSLIYTPQLFDKMNYYFFGVLYYMDADSITYYANRVLDKISSDSTMMRYFMDFITPRYERSTKRIGWDQVFVNLVNDHYLKGHCPWATEAELFSKRQTVEFLSHSLIGAIGQELLMADTNQSPNPADWISSHAFPQKYVMLWFWDPDCNHCKKQTAELIVLYDSLKAAGNQVFEVYAVGYEADVDKWKRYVRQHKLPFVNVGGSNVNIDYQEAYNVHGAPTMILLDADRRIIMNKTLPTKEVLPFIERYERLHPEQKDRQPSYWQLEGIRRTKIK